MKVLPLADGLSGVQISDIQLATASRDELLAIGKQTVENLILVIRDQKLTPEDEVRVCRTIGSVEEVTAFNRCPIGADGAPIAEIQRVTGMLHPDGTPMGLFGHDHDLEWHANRPSADKDRKPIIWLRSVFGTSGTRTSWANCAAAFDELPEDLKRETSDLLGIYGYEPGRYTSWNEWKSHRNFDGIPLVQTVTGTGRRGLYFPFLQLFGFKDRSDEYSKDLIEKLTKHVLQDKFVYHHDWRDGDIVMSEQWLTIHKRWACDVSQRLLHRISFAYENVKWD